TLKVDSGALFFLLGWLRRRWRRFVGQEGSRHCGDLDQKAFQRGALRLRIEIFRLFLQRSQFKREPLLGRREFQLLEASDDLVDAASEMVTGSFVELSFGMKILDEEPTRGHVRVCSE